MRLERAYAKAIRYAIMNWHYSKSVPMVQVGYAVFNDAGDWCGVVCYSIGANNNIASPYGLKQGQVAELVRVALNGKQESTSKAVAISLKLLRKDCPLAEMLVSYADTGQEHIGVIYQAGNWVFTGRQKVTAHVFDPKKGKAVQAKTINSTYGSQVGLIKVASPDKLKYICPLTKAAKAIAETLRKPYPKKPAPILEDNTQLIKLQRLPAPEAQTDERLSSTQEAGGSIPTPALFSLPTANPTPATC